MISPTTEKILYDKNGLQIRSGTPDVVKINSKTDKRVEGIIKLLFLSWKKLHKIQTIRFSFISLMLKSKPNFFFFVYSLVGDPRRATERFLITSSKKGTIYIVHRTKSFCAQELKYTQTSI